MIYIVKHKEYNNPIPKEYKELYVGDMFKNNDLDNINKLNPYLNEATGLYEIWKNCNDDIVGLVHYRRFFLCDYNMAKEILKDYDIIITKDVVFDKGIYEQLRSEVDHPEVLDKYYNKLCELEPELKEWFELKKFNPKEMFICKKTLIDKYCEWLFNIMIPLTEEFIREDKDKVFNKRILGHLTERLFSYWIYKNKLNCYRIDYIDL